MNKNTILEVNKKTFLDNYEKIKNYIYPKKIIPIVKAHAYGTYLDKDIELMNNFDILGVARIEEGISLRKLGYNKEILILNQISYEELEEVYNYNLTIGLATKEMISKINKKVKIHLEIETGMNRTGINVNDLELIIKEIKNNNNIIVEGVYTHFSSADSDIDYTNKQISIFQKAVNILKKHFNLKYIHSSASSGLLNFDDKVSNYTRPGILLYGYEPYKGAKEKINVVGTTSLKTKITFIKEVDKNTSISYNQKFITKEKMTIATIPIGYADGLKRSLSNIEDVLVKNKRCRILGNICMDSCMIDITGLDVKIGDEVIIWNNKDITLEEISNNANTISYEILSTITDRIERKIK